MNAIIINKWAMGLAVFSFGFLSIGSFLFGATATTSILRALGGAVFFGALLWLVGLLVSEEEDPVDDNIEEDGGQDSVVINTEAVREKFLKKSAELKNKELEQKNKELEQKNKEEEKEATPF